MPEFSDIERAEIVKQSGMDPSLFDYDEQSQTIRRKPRNVSPSSAPDSLAKQQDTLTSPTVGSTIGPVATALGTAGVDAVPALAGGAASLGIGAGLTALAAPLALSGPPGWLVGAGILGASALGGYGISKLAKEQAVEPIIESINPGTIETLRKGQEANPWSARLGGLGGMALGGMKPGMTAIGAIPKKLMGMSTTAAEQLALKNAAASGGIGAGINVFDAARQGQMPEIGSTIESALMGSIMSSPNAIGRKMGFHDPANVKIEPNINDLAKPADIKGAEVFNPISSIPLGGDLTTQQFWQHLNEQRLANEGQDLPYKFTQAMEEKSAKPIKQVLQEVRIPETPPTVKATPIQLEQLRRAAEFSQARQEAALQNADEVANFSGNKPLSVGNLSNFANRVGAKPAQAVERTIARPEVKPEIVEDNTLRQKQSNEEVAAENDLVERQWEGTGDKYSTESGILTKTQQEAREAALHKDLPTQSTPYWKSFFDTLGKKRNVKLTDDGTIVDNNGKPIAGSVPNRVGANTVEGKINPNMEGADTRPHETAHPFINDLLKSTRGRDRIIASKALKATEQLPEYQEWAKQRLLEGNQATPEEFLVTNIGVEAWNRATNSRNETAVTKWWKDNKAYFKTRFTEYATPEEMQRVLYYKMLHDPSFNETIPSNLRVKTPGAGALNSSQSTFDKLDKDADVASKFALMRKAVDDPALAKKIEAEAEAKNMREDLADGHNNQRSVSDEYYSDKSIFSPEELASGEIKLNNQPKPLEEQRKPVAIVPQEQKLPITHTSVVDKISDLIKFNEDMTMPVDRADKMRQSLLDTINFTKAPEMKAALESPEFDTTDADHWKVINKLHNVALDRVENESKKPIQIPRTIPDVALESSKEVKPVEQTQKPKREKVSRSSKKDSLESSEIPGIEFDKIPGVDYIPGEVQKNSVPNNTKPVKEVEPIELLKQTPAERQAEYKKNVEMWDEVESTRRPYETLKKIEDSLIEQGKRLDTIPTKDSPEGKHVKSIINNLHMQRSVLSDKFKIPVKSLDETFSDNGVRSKYSNKSMFWKAEIDKIRKLEHRDADLVADALDNTLRLKTRYVGDLVNDITVKLLPELDYRKPKEIFFQDNKRLQDTLNYMYDMQDNGSSTIKPDATILKIVKDNLAKSLAAKNLSLNGKQKADPNYVPNMVSRNVLDKWLNAPHSNEAAKYVKDWYAYYAKQGKTQVEAKKALEILKAGYTKQESNLASQFGPIDDSAGIGLPRSWREKNLIDLFTRFNDRYARRLAYIEGIEKNTKVKDALENPEDGLKAATEVKNVLDELQGVREVNEMGRTAVMGVVKAAWMGTLTGTKDFASNLTLGFQHQTIPQALTSPFKAWGSMKQHMAESFDKGINRNNIGSIEFGDEGISNAVQVLRRTRDALNTVSGRNILERVTRATAYGQGKWLAIDNIVRANKRSLTSQTKKFLDDFVPDWQKYAKTGTLPPEVAMEAGARYTESVQGRYDYSGLPALSQKGSLAPFLALSRWNIEKLNNFEKHVVKPALNGNFSPLLMSTLGMFLGGEAVNQIVQAVSGRKERTPKVEELKEIAKSGNDVVMPITYKLAALASLSGYAGIAGDLTKMAMDKYYKNKVQLFNSPMLEIIAQASQTSGDIVEALIDGDTDITMDVITQMLEDTFQVYRIAQAQMSPEKKEELEKANKLRDLKLWKNTHGYKTSDTTSDRPNPFMNKDIRDFKGETDIDTVAKELPGLIDKAIAKGGDNPDIIDSELNKLRGSKYNTMPSPQRTPYSFQKYYEFLVETQGQEQADKVLEDYMEVNAIDKYKNKMIPSIK